MCNKGPPGYWYQNTVWHASALQLHKSLLHNLARPMLVEKFFLFIVIPKKKAVSVTKRGKLFMYKGLNGLNKCFRGFLKCID